MALAPLNRNTCDTRNGKINATNIYERASSLFTAVNQRGDRRGVTELVLHNWLESSNIELPANAQKLFFLDGDLDGDGVLSEQEFVQVFTTSYSTVLDILYFHLCDIDVLNSVTVECQKYRDEKQQKLQQLTAAEHKISELQVEFESFRSTVADLSRASAETKDTVDVLVAKYDHQVDMRDFIGEELAEVTSDLKAAEEVCVYRKRENDEWQQRVMEWIDAEKNIAAALHDAEAGEEELRIAYEAAKNKTSEQRKVHQNAQFSLQESRDRQAEIAMLMEDAASRFEASCATHSLILSRWNQATEGVHNLECEMRHNQKCVTDIMEVLRAKELSMSNVSSEQDRVEQHINLIKEEVEFIGLRCQQLFDSKEKLLVKQNARKEKEIELLRKELEIREEKKQLQLKELALRHDTQSVFVT